MVRRKSGDGLDVRWRQLRRNLVEDQRSAAIGVFVQHGVIAAVFVALLIACTGVTGPFKSLDRERMRQEAMAEFIRIANADATAWKELLRKDECGNRYDPDKAWAEFQTKLALEHARIFVDLALPPAIESVAQANRSGEAPDQLQARLDPVFAAAAETTAHNIGETLLDLLERYGCDRRTKEAMRERGQRTLETVGARSVIDPDRQPRALLFAPPVRVPHRVAWSYVADRLAPDVAAYEPSQLPQALQAAQPIVEPVAQPREGYRITYRSMGIEIVFARSSTSSVEPLPISEPFDVHGIPGMLSSNDGQSRVTWIQAGGSYLVDAVGISREDVVGVTRGLEPIAGRSR